MVIVLNGAFRPNYSTFIADVPMFSLRGVLNLFAQKNDPACSRQVDEALRNNEDLNEIVARFDQVYHRTDLSAPEVFAEESFPDINIVAEYLNYCLDDPVLLREYERIAWADPALLSELLDVSLLEEQWQHSPVFPTDEVCHRRLYQIGQQGTPIQKEVLQVPEEKIFIDNKPIINKPITGKPVTDQPARTEEPTNRGFYQFCQLIVVLTVLPFLILLLFSEAEFPKKGMERVRSILRGHSPTKEPATTASPVSGDISASLPDFSSSSVPGPSISSFVIPEDREYVR